MFGRVGERWWFSCVGRTCFIGRSFSFRLYFSFSVSSHHFVFHSHPQNTRATQRALYDDDDKLLRTGHYMKKEKVCCECFTLCKQAPLVDDDSSLLHWSIPSLQFVSFSFFLYHHKHPRDGWVGNKKKYIKRHPKKRITHMNLSFER